ncbi:MAG TPA: Si-specific NAD(P)(+) transhydrogenase [Polyangia bacterium]|nr:Si-specific NAD(P)(+) transhydrogenase [Polyangia bacterium]
MSASERGGQTSDEFDLVVIGSGPAGEKGAAQAAYFGKRVALVERAPALGGASVHTGTLPSKTLRETALYMTGFQRRRLYGMSLEIDRDASLRQLMGRIRAVTEQQVAQIDRSMDRHGVTVVQGEASFTGTNEVVVKNRDAAVPPRTLRAPYFLVAPGSSPHRPAGVPFDDPDVEDSDTILDLDRIPLSLAVVGGGVIGCEYACLFAALGTAIIIVEGRGALLGGLDGEMSAGIKASLERNGHEVMLGDAVESIARVPGGPLRIVLKSGKILQVDKILYSAGRAGNTAGLALERAGLAVDNRGRLPVNEHFQTAQPHIYAAGDVIGNPALASVSMEQGRVAACHAFSIPYKTHVAPLTPFGVYTIPEISMVGPTEEELKAKGTPYEVGRARYEHNARGQIIGETDGALKLLFDPTTRKLLGVHIIGDRATELIHIGQMVMINGGAIDAFIDAVFNFPTLAEMYKYAAYDGLGRLAKRGVLPPIVPR